jgi:hypothetical protein
MKDRTLKNLVYGIALIGCSLLAERDGLSMRRSGIPVLGMSASVESVIAFVLAGLAGVLGLFSLGLAIGLINRDK